MIRRPIRALLGALLPLAGTAALGGPLSLATASSALACGDEAESSCGTDEDDDCRPADIEAVEV